MSPIEMTGPRRMWWSRNDYYRMAQVGLFKGRRVERLDGEIIEMAPQNSLHAETVTVVDDVLRGVFGGGYRVRVQLPLALGTGSDPEPDVAVVAGRAGDFRDAHPTKAVLVVEVADSSLSYDRGRKAQVYAEAQIPEYWIVNLLDGTVEVYRTPVASGEQPQGFAYRDVTVLRRGEDLVPTAAPSARISVGDLLL